MPRPRSSYFICFTARSGSNFLSDVLAETGVAGVPREYLPKETLRVSPDAAAHDPEWVQDWNARPFAACLETVFDHGTSPNGVLGIKVEAPNLRYLQRMLARESGVAHLPFPQQLTATFPDLRYIWVTRRHKVRQAVSFFKAQQTGAWKSLSGEKPTAQQLTFNFQLIDQYLRQILQDEADWGEYFSSSRIVPCTVVYEDLALEYERTVRQVLDYLQIALPAEYTFPAPRLQKQADGLSEEWVRRYEEAASARHSYRRWLNLPLMLRSSSLRYTFVHPTVRAQRTELLNRACRLVGLSTQRQVAERVNRLRPDTTRLPR